MVVPRVARKCWQEKYLIYEIDPVKLLPILERAEVLDQRDCESIIAAAKSQGGWYATQSELLMRLKKRGPCAFSKFVAALREAGFSHAAQLLDPEFKVTDTISNGRRDDRVLAAGVCADIRVKMNFKALTHEQTKQVESFRETYKKSGSEDTTKLRNHFDDFFDKDIRKFVNLVKTTWSEETALIFVFRLSKLDAANLFWKSFENKDLESTLQVKLQSFSNENNCFKNGDIHYDVFVERDDYDKVCHTLQHPEECKVLVDGMEKQELKLRDYQIELVKPALEGKNTIICAPTGSGKTFVAMEAIKQQATKETETDRKYIAFIVNTVSLVEQQRSCLERYLPDSVAIASVCGSNPDISLPSVLEDSHVVVLTAQVLLNSLKKKKEDSEEKDVSISQFSLLVFDECHHTTKEHPYNEIMKWYIAEKLNSEACPPSLPQIIGLSASLGIGTGNVGDGTRAEQHIMGLCANLDAHELQVHTDKQYTDTTIRPITSDHTNMFHTTISDVMTEIETMMPSSSSSDTRPPFAHGSQPYENWVVNLLKNDLGRDFVTCAEQLKLYNSSLMINDEIRSEDALQYLLKNIKNQESTEIEIGLRGIFDTAVVTIKEGLGDCEPNPGLQKLEGLLREKLISCDRQSKGIIFVKTRYVAGALVNWLENTQGLNNLVKNPTWVIGCGPDGMSKANQDRAIWDFRDGDCNIIVATSALLEGIDIPKCNFVINYSMPGNEITHVQARGRARTEHNDDCTYDIMVPVERLMLKQRDLMKEKLMEEAVAKVKRKSKEDFEKRVESLQQKAYKEYRENLARQGTNQARSVHDDLDFHCIKCGVFACKAKHIKMYETAHIVPNHEVNLHNVKFDKVKDNSKQHGMPGGFNKTGKTYCAHCGRDWGNRSKNQYGEFPVLKIEGFRVKRSSGSSNVYKKWREFPYQLENFDPENDSDCSYNC